MLAAALLTVAACSPELDWRDVRPDGSGATLLLPCKAESRTRDVRLAGSSVHLTLLNCSAGGITWALAFADVGDPRRVRTALDELMSATQANLGAAGARSLPLAVPGSTPDPGAGRVQFSGHLPEGAEVKVQTAVFSRGTWVFQATVLGRQLPAQALETFFGALRLE